VKLLFLPFHSSKQAQFVLSLATLFVEVLLFWLKMALLSFVQLTLLFVALVLEFVSELAGGNFAFFLRLNLHKICAQFRSKLSNLSLSLLLSEVFEDLETSDDSPCHFSLKKS
jgi:hypothetical protein